jgi:hypothetical protein
VGFIALLEIATNDGVIVASYPKQLFEKNGPKVPRESARLPLPPV